MKLSVYFLSGFLLIAAEDSLAGALNDRRKSAKECELVQQKIRNIESRMRAGYTAAQGIRLEKKLRKLKDQRYRLC